jgi:hypothetical protein
VDADSSLTNESPAIAVRPLSLFGDCIWDWRAGRNTVYQLAAPAMGARLALADA